MDNTESSTLTERFWEATVIDSFKTFSEFQKQGLLCDLTLSTKDGLEFKVHKLVMCSVSGFFKNLFSSDFKDSSDDTVQLDVSTGAILKQIITFVYQGDIEADKAEDLVEIAKIAKYLQINKLSEMCLLRVEKLINDSTCLNCWRLAKDYLIEDVEYLCISHILRYAQRLFQDPSFVNDLTVSEMKILLEDKRLKCDPETIFKTVENWALNNTNTIDKFLELFSDFLDYFQIFLFSRKFLLSKVLQNEVLMEDKKLVRKFAESMRYNWEGNQRILEKNPKFPKLTSEWKKQYLAISGTDMLVIPAREGQVKKFRKNCYLFSHFGYTTFENNLLLACGGFNTSKNAPESTCKYFSPITKDWTSMPPMSYPKWGHRCVCLNGKIYVCGGVKESIPCESVEIFDVNAETWITGPNMKTPRSRFGLTSLNGSLYAVGNYKNVSNMEMLDPRASNQWSYIQNNMNILCSQCISIGYDIICLYLGCKLTIFDTRMNQSRMVSLCPLFDEDVDWPHVCEINDEIGVFFSAKCVFCRINLKGQITSRCTILEASKSSGISALVAMYY